MLVLEDGQIAWGDCAAVQYSGAGGRDPLFLAEEFIPLIETHIKPVLVGREADSFRDLCRDMEAITIDGKRLHTALRYGLSQAILDAVAKATGRLMCEVVADEYGCTVTETPIPHLHPVRRRPVQQRRQDDHQGRTGAASRPHQQRQGEAGAPG